MDNTVFVTLCDAPYFGKAHQTIKDLRIRGKWNGAVILITVDYTPDPLFLERYNVQTVSFPRIELAAYLEKIREKPFTEPTNDGRELKKTTQWEKLHAFDPFFKQWERQIWVDAGMRILDSVEYILEVPWAGKFTAPQESYPFEQALERKNWPAYLFEAQEKFRIKMNGNFFINCFWIYDTRLDLLKSEFLQCLEYPIWRHNEMGAMNAVIRFHHELWQPLPSHASNGKHLYAWSDFDFRKDWTHFVLIKYPVSLRFDV